MAGQGIDEVAAELYSVPPSRFVPARDEAVRRARDGGDRDLAGQIGRLRKPTMAAWAVNLLARSAASRIDELVSLGERLRSAQQALQGDQLRELNRQRREVVGSLSREAAGLAADAGYPLSGAALVEVEQTLVAALAEEDAALVVRQGRLTRSLQHVGMGAEPLLPPELTVAAPPERSPRSSRSSGSSRPAREPSAAEPSVAEPSVAGRSASGQAGEDELTRRRRRREQRREQELRRATTELDQAESRLGRAEQDARRAEERATRAERKLAELQREHADALQARDEARRRARSAVRVRDDARRRVQRLTEDNEAH